MRYAARRDNSHRSIADALETAGAIVLEGFDCDLYVRFRDRAWLIETLGQPAFDEAMDDRFVQSLSSWL